MKRKIALILPLLTLFFLVGTYAYSFRDPLDQKNPENNRSTPLSAETMEEQQNKIINIALFGIDTGREKHEAVHSDAIMIVTMDPVHKKIKLSSLMRDTYVDIEGRGKTKINLAYAIGGPELAVKTINKNFNMDIEHYATVDFVGLSKIVDALDGVEADIKRNEIEEINKYMEEVAKIKKEKPTPLRIAGRQRLNGNQAVAYARIRNVGEGDFDRSERQKNVLTALAQKIQEQDISKYPQLAAALLPYIQTNMSGTDILQFGTELYKLGISNMDWYRFPLYGYCQGEIINKVWYLTTDLPTTSEHLHQYIYNDVKVEPLKNSF